MKREDLQKIEGLSKEQIEKIMDIHKEDVTDWTTRMNNQKAEIQSRDQKITELTDQVKEFDGVDVKQLQEDVENWKTKYTTDLAAKDKEYAKKSFFDGIPFASNLAKKAAMADFDAKDLEFKDGKFLGADDFIASLKEEDPTAFKAEDHNKNKSTGAPQGGSLGSSDISDVEKRFYDLNPGLKPKE